MPQLTNAEKRIRCMRRLVEELESLIDLDTDRTRLRCLAIVNALGELLRAQDAHQRGVAPVIGRARHVQQRAQAAVKAAIATPERTELIRTFIRSDPVPRRKKGNGD